MKCAGVHPVQTPWLYIYFSKQAKDVGVAQQRTYERWLFISS